MPSTRSLPTPGNDRAVMALGLALLAVALGYALDLKDGLYAPWPLAWLTFSVVLGVAAVAWPALPVVEWFSGKVLALALAVGIAIQVTLVLYKMEFDSQVSLGIAAIAMLGCVQFFDLGGLRIPLALVAAGAFLFVGGIQFNKHAQRAGIDVFMFQHHASYALTHGLNPYTFRYPNIYPTADASKFYGPGVVGSDGYLTYGFPYPPLSLLMVLPGYWLGDIRYADVAAMALSAALMAAARGGRAGRIGAMAGVLFLLTPRAVLVLDYGWTEPLLMLNFSLAMFCACRWRKALPYALGLFFATKQYTILALPLLPLLVEGEHRWRDLRSMIARAGLVVAAFNLPFLFWNINAFTRAIVEFQLVQPFRPDALSYLVWIFKNFDGLKLPIWTPLLAIVPAYGLCLWRCARTPAGFAAALMLVDLIFFAFNKQAFCNYYYFVIGAACWAIAASQVSGVTSLISPLKNNVLEKEEFS